MFPTKHNYSDNDNFCKEQKYSCKLKEGFVAYQSRSLLYIGGLVDY